MDANQLELDEYNDYRHIYSRESHRSLLTMLQRIVYEKLICDLAMFVSDICYYLRSDSVIPAQWREREHHCRQTTSCHDISCGWWLYSNLMSQYQPTVPTLPTSHTTATNNGQTKQ